MRFIAFTFSGSRIILTRELEISNPLPDVNERNARAHRGL
jgi:hypothetical protein